MYNKETYAIDREYRNTLKKVCIYVLSFNRGLPLEWQDLYNDFLSIAPKIVKEYDKTKGVTLKVYLIGKCKMHCYNYCRHFKGNAHKPMNENISIDLEKYKALGEGVWIEDPIDTSVFSKLEMIVYIEYFLDDESMKDIAIKHKMSRYKIRRLVDSVKDKLIIQLKN